MTPVRTELRVYKTPHGWRYQVGSRDDGNYITRAEARIAGVTWLQRQIREE